MALRFKLIAILIFLSLVVVSGYQVYWLKSFYDEQSAQLEVDIMEALRNADYKEIYRRINSLRSDTIHQYNAAEMSVVVPDRNNPDHHNSVSSSIIQGGDTVRINSNSEFPVDIFDNADAMLKYFQKGLHQTVGDIKEVDFAAYNNLLQIELTQRGIMMESFTEMVDLEHNKVMASIPADTTIITDRSEYQSYLFPFDIDGNYAYRLNIKQPRVFIMKQMTGIISISLLMIVSLFLSYIYLLKIIYKQKALDEIKSDFVNNMTHELKTPISVAYAVTDALQNYGIMDDPVKRGEYLQVSKEQLMHLNGLVEQILTMSVEERKNLKLSCEPVVMQKMFEQLKSQYLLHAHKKVSIDIEVEPADLTVWVDKIHFQNVIGNLIENSIKYSGEEVQISLSARMEGEWACVEVKDNGIGISSSSLPKIFDRFYRVSTGNIHDVKGYGLGLYYVKTIVEKHGGTIRAESELGKGTKFVIKIYEHEDTRSRRKI